MTTTLKALLLVTLVIAACGGSSATGGSPPTSPSAKALNVDSGGTACATGQQQNLVFDGAMKGSLTCPTGQPTCSQVINGRVDNKLVTIVIRFVAGGKPVQLSMGIGPLRGLGVYQADNSEGGSVITLDGPTNWLSRKGDSMTILTFTGSGLTGTLDSTLEDHAYADIRVTGSWACDRVNY